MRLDSFRTGKKLVWISLVFILDVADPVRIRSICFLAPNESTYKGDPIWNCIVSVSSRSRVNRMDPYHSGSDPKRI